MYYCCCVYFPFETCPSLPNTFSHPSPVQLIADDKQTLHRATNDPGKEKWESTGGPHPDKTITERRKGVRARFVVHVFMCFIPASMTASSASGIYQTS